jgi:predicted amino acid racemase
MAQLIIKTDKILENIEKLSYFLNNHNIIWSLTVKVLSGNKESLKKLLNSEIIKTTHSIADSRLSNLKNIKSINPDIKTMYIKPPAVQSCKTVVDVADYSFNTSYETLQELNRFAAEKGIIHKVVVMIEMGELREGIMRDDLIDFYSKCFELKHIKVVGIGTNLGCMYGVEPTFDKLVQLSLYKQLIEAKFNRHIELISGGSSITLPLITKQKIPELINHFRIGEAAFLGVTPLTGKRFKNLACDAFEFKANIIEMEKKENKPDGIISEANISHTAEITSNNESYKAILDFGILDVDTNDLIPKSKNLKFLGTTSDMTVYDLGRQKIQKFNVGSAIGFKPNYMAVARLMNSRYIEKKVL